MKTLSILPLATLLILSLLLSSCEKEEIPPGGTDEPALKLAIGDHAGMIHSTAPWILNSPANNYSSLDVDLTGDSGREILLWNNNSQQQLNKFSLLFTYGLEIAYRKKEDTIYSCFRDSSGNHLITNFNLYCGYNCQDSLIFYSSTTHYIPEIRSLGDSIRSSWKWRSGDFHLARNIETHRVSPITGTPYHEFLETLETFEEWNGLGPAYFAIRIPDEDSYRYGWAKMEVLDYHQIHLLEYALQP